MMGHFEGKRPVGVETDFRSKGDSRESVFAKGVAMPYNPLVIANYFLDRAESRGEQLSPMKLQKLVYYAHGWCLALTGEPLLDEPIHAWLYGPVVNSIFRKFRRFGSQEITTRATVPDSTSRTNNSTRRLDQVASGSVPEAIDQEITPFLDRVWEIYGRYSANQLSNQSHEPGTPWSEVSARYPDGVPRRVIIPDDRIKVYFAKQLVAEAVEA